MNCVHPIEKLIDHLKNEILENDISNDNGFLDLLEEKLGRNILYFSNNGDVCCPDCKPNKLGLSIYFCGNINSYENFLIQDKFQKPDCCLNYIASYNQSNIDERNQMFNRVEKCCNKSTSDMAGYILKLEKFYDNANEIHTFMCDTNPFSYFLDKGIVEFGTINNESVLGDILNNVESLETDSFKFIFLAYILDNGLIIKCGRGLDGYNPYIEQVSLQIVKR